MDKQRPKYATNRIGRRRLFLTFWEVKPLISENKFPEMTLRFRAVKRCTINLRRSTPLFHLAGRSLPGLALACLDLPGASLGFPEPSLDSQGSKRHDFEGLPTCLLVEGCLFLASPLEGV